MSVGICLNLVLFYINQNLLCTVPLCFWYCDFSFLYCTTVLSVPKGTGEQTTSIQVLYVPIVHKCRQNPPQEMNLIIHRPSHKLIILGTNETELYFPDCKRNKSSYQYTWSRCTEILSNSLVLSFPCRVR